MILSVSNLQNVIETGEDNVEIIVKNIGRRIPIPNTSQQTPRHRKPCHHDGNHAHQFD